MQSVYKEQLSKLLESHFIIHREVTGSHLLTGESCRADFLCFPRQKAIDKGFEEFWFVIECKSPKSSESMKKCLDGLAQSLSYRDTDFDGRRPEMVFLFPNILRFLEHDNQNKYADQPLNQSKPCDIVLLRRFLEQLNIGEIFTCPRRGFLMKFASNRLYDPHRGRSNVPNLGRAVRVGSR